MFGLRVRLQTLSGRPTQLVFTHGFCSAPPPLVRKVLIANRGEIACRVINTCRKLGIPSVAVFSDEDVHAKHVRLADEAYRIGPAPSLQSYLCGDVIADLALKVGADAIHPGYGFLSENENFAELCATRGLRFVGPPPQAIRAMGSKSESKHIMEKAGVPVVPGYHEESQADHVLKEAADKIGYPVIIKPVMGGGGKGMRIVTKPEDFAAALESSRSEAIHSFKDDRVLIERYLTRPRHIEVQVFCDMHGNAVYLFERDCSVQRRHQKIFEEAPAPLISDELRRDLGQKAVAAAKAVGYVGAGTVEFIMDADTGEFFFMEMNTRLQVEHPVSEAITGVDLVEWQLKVASNHRLPLQQDQLKIDGHAIEVRIYAEDPYRNFMPTAGRVTHLKTPNPTAVFSTLGETGVRIDSGVDEGDKVSTHYDPMIAKLIVKGRTRDQALSSLKRALNDYHVTGVDTNIEFLRRVCDHPTFVAGGVDTSFIGKFEKQLMPPRTFGPTHTSAVMGAIATLLNRQAGSLDAFRVNYSMSREVTFETGEPPCRLTIPLIFHSPTHVTANLTTNVYLRSCVKDTSFAFGERLFLVADVNGQRSLTTVVFESAQPNAVADGSETLHVFSSVADEATNTIHTKLRIPRAKFLDDAGHVGGAGLVAPMPGEIQKVLVKAGDSVEKGDRLVVLVAMKMEHVISAPKKGKVKEVLVGTKESVRAGQALLVLED